MVCPRNPMNEKGPHLAGLLANTSRQLLCEGTRWMLAEVDATDRVPAFYHWFALEKILQLFHRHLTVDGGIVGPGHQRVDPAGQCLVQGGRQWAGVVRHAPRPVRVDPVTNGVQGDLGPAVRAAGGTW
jgi:hypothetical protein